MISGIFQVGNSKIITNSLIHYTNLTPDRILDAVESLGLYPEASLLPLNSYENRVYQLRMEDGSRLVAKFYRPERWSDLQILEEHQFCFELTELELPVVAPMIINGKSLHEHEGYRFSLFESRGGRTLEIEKLEHLKWMGRFIARIHNVGHKQSFTERLTIDVKSYGWDAIEIIKSSGYLPMELQNQYLTIANQVCQACENVFQSIKGIDTFRLHGDCHPSNVLWSDKGPHFVDFDDARNGPAIQDLWMLLSGDEEQMREQWHVILEGYEDFRDFDDKEIALIEPLRGLRMLHYCGWLSSRWQDPSFQHNFPWFTGHRYWEEQILSLKEQLAAIQQPPLKVMIGNDFY